MRPDTGKATRLSLSENAFSQPSCFKLLASPKRRLFIVFLKFSSFSNYNVS